MLLPNMYILNISLPIALNSHCSCNCVPFFFHNLQPLWCLSYGCFMDVGFIVVCKVTCIPSFALFGDVVWVNEIGIYVCICISLFSRSLRYCSVVIGISFRCHVVLIMMCPVFVIEVLYDQPW